MDREHADFEQVYQDIKTHLTEKVIPVEIPVGNGADFHGIINLFSGKAHLADALERHMSAPLPIVGAGEPVSAAIAALEKSDALLVHDEGKPAGVLTRQDLLSHHAAA